MITRRRCALPVFVMLRLAFGRQMNGAPFGDREEGGDRGTR